MISQGSTVLLLALLKNLRPSQWSKNIFVLAPLFFAQKLTETNSLLRSLAAAAAFCLLASGVYLWNDLADLEEDRRHPKKSLRPLASGSLSVVVAKVSMFALWSMAFLLSEPLGLGFLLCCIAYLLLNVFYSLWLRNLAFIDVTCIALGFLLRVLAGGHAIDVSISGWMLLNTFLLTFFMGLGKRYQEALRETQTSARVSLRYYQIDTLRTWIRYLGFCTGLLYMLYASLPSTRAYFGSNLILLTIPFPALGIWRFLALAETKQESPTEAILRDLPFLAIVCSWALLIFWIVV